MVTVLERSPEQIRDWADRVIPDLITQWCELPNIAAEINSWETGEALDYIEEWPLYENERRNLERVAVADVLTAEQYRQLAELRELVTQHKPILDRLLRR